jgi:tetratricopeptide (TPR) repeat protein
MKEERQDSVPAKLLRIESSPMSDLRVCRVCGREVAAGEASCPGCGAALGVPFRGEPLLLLSLVGLVLLFVITGIVSSRYHARQRDLGAQWYAKGTSELAAGHAPEAILDLRNALVYSRDNQTYQLRLAEASVAAGRFSEAEAYLKSLWEEQPANGPVNLELGRLAAREGNVADALRYYHNAGYADWGPGDNGGKSRAARLELYQFLVDQGKKSLAQAELMEMAATLPAEASLHLQMGQLFLGAGEPNRALPEFLEAIKLGASEEAAWAGAGAAAFKTGDYRTARRYLAQARRKNPEDTDVTKQLDLAELVLGNDPFEAGISPAERSERIARAYKQALDRLQACGAKAPAPPVKTTSGETPGHAPASLQPSDLDLLYAQALALKAKVEKKAFAHDADLQSQVMDWVFRAEELAERQCSAPSGFDQALLLIQQNHKGS